MFEHRNVSLQLHIATQPQPRLIVADLSGPATYPPPLSLCKATITRELLMFRNLMAIVKALVRQESIN